MKISAIHFPLKKFIVIILTILFLVCGGYLFKSYILNKPSNNRNWESGQEKLAKISFMKQMILIGNIRDWEYDANGPVSFGYTNDAYDPSQIKQTYFLVEPFSKWDAVAHTFVEFEFNDGKTILVSIESRREKDEKFSAFWGLFNNYEIIYIWGTEKDLMGRRLNLEKSTIYKYPLEMPQEYSRNLFMQMVNETKAIEDNPKFYNTMTDNCTNRIAYAANAIKPGVIPFDISWFLPGYSDQLLQKVGFIDKTKSIEELRKIYKVESL